MVNRSLNFAFENGLTKEKIVITLHLKNQQIRKVQAFERQEQVNLENYIWKNNKIYYFGILLSLYTGLRLGEVLALKWQNIELECNHFLQVTFSQNKHQNIFNSVLFSKHNPLKYHLSRTRNLLCTLVIAE